MKATLRSVVELLGWGCALLAAVQLPGAVLDSVIRQGVGPPAIVPLVLIGAAALILRRRAARGWPKGARALAAAAVAFGLAATLAQLAPLLTRGDMVEVREFGIVVPAAGRSTECRGRPPRCHDLVLNELGFRGALATRSTPAAKLVVFVGDSYIFGSGVGEEDTVPAAVARMLSDVEPPPAIVNAGIPGLNGGSFAGVIRYVATRLHPDVIVVLLKDDDLDDTDKFTRWSQFQRSFWFRLLSVSNLELIHATGRLAWRRWFVQADSSTALRQHLDRIAAAAAGARLVVIAALAGDLRAEFDAWMAAHPRVAQVSAWDDARYWEAEKIPRDGHWTEAGCETIAAMVAPAIRRQLSAASRPSRAGAAGRRSFATAASVTR